MKRRSFFAVLVAPLAMLWLGLKRHKERKPSPIEVFAAAYEVGIEFDVSFGTRDGAVMISKTSPPRTLPSRWVALTRHKVISLSEQLLDADKLVQIGESFPVHSRRYCDVFDEAAEWLVNSMTPDEKKRYHRCLAKSRQYANG